MGNANHAGLFPGVLHSRCLAPLLVQLLASGAMHCHRYTSACPPEVANKDAASKSIDPCNLAGLLGGAVYVNAFTLISRDIDPKYREFSLSAASLGDSLGIAFADVTGILIQV